MKPFAHVFADLAITAAAILVAIALVMAGLYLAGYPAHLVVFEWTRGALGSRFDLAVAAKNACPLIFTGLAAAVAFRSGVFNIGAEGQSILGAIATAFVATRWLPAVGQSWVAIPAALVCAAIFGAVWAVVPSLLDRYRGVPIVLSTILLNFIALQLLSLLLEGPLKAKGTEVVQSDPLPLAYWLPGLVDVGYLRIGILIALGVAALVWLIQARTSFGFELLVTGLNPTVARLSGMPVAARQLGIMMISGAIAGLAGAIQVMGIEGHFLGPTPVSYGYAGIAVALLGRLHPVGVVLAAFFFGLLDQGASNVEISRYGLPHEVADIVKGLIVLIILVGTAYVARLRTTVREA
ncbi:MAG TPA: ABC transporter permease [Phycisphaerae bacterium]|nr:ABC transporter permease [Phycisphaerae bacterium]